MVLWLLEGSGTWVQFPVLKGNSSKTSYPLKVVYLELSVEFMEVNRQTKVLTTNAGRLSVVFAHNHVILKTIKVFVPEFTR